MGWGRKDEALLRWLGSDKFAERSLGRQALNGLGHFAIGLVSGGVAGVVAQHPAAIVGSAIGAAAIRELYQYLGNRQAHLLDRLRDIGEAGVGGLAAWVIWMLAF